MASHILDEVEKICTHVAIIKRTVTGNRSVGSIINSDITVELASADMEQLKSFPWCYTYGKRLENKGKTIEIGIDQNADHSLLNRMAFEQGILLTHFVARKKRLETEFLEITSKAG